MAGNRAGFEIETCDRIGLPLFQQNVGRRADQGRAESSPTGSTRRSSASALRAPDHDRAVGPAIFHRRVPHDVIRVAVRDEKGRWR